MVPNLGNTFEGAGLLAQLDPIVVLLLVEILDEKDGIGASGYPDL